MPSAPKIRKEILHILESSILPALRQREVLQILAGPPFDFSALQTRVLRKEFLPDNDEGPLQVLRHWPEENLVAARMPNFSFCYAGAMHKKIGIIERMGNEIVRQGLPHPGGLLLLKVPSPSMLVSIPFIAREDNPNQPFLDEDISNTCSVNIENGEVKIFHSSRKHGIWTSSHHLVIEDPLLYRLWAFYYDAVCQHADPASTQTLLMAAFVRLHYQLSHTRPQISHSSWLQPSTSLQYHLPRSETKQEILCRELIDYVHHNLHLPLSMKMLAEHFNVSAFHLNRVFRASQNTTVMHYVTELRVKAAQRMLAGNSERISDVAQLTGFNSIANFSTVFRRHTGLTPSQYRKMHNKSEK
jgi:AraC-like DNA-binding protein